MLPLQVYTNFRGSLDNFRVWCAAAPPAAHGSAVPPPQTAHARLGGQQVAAVSG